VKGRKIKSRTYSVSEWRDIYLSLPLKGRKELDEWFAKILQREIDKEVVKELVSILNQASEQK
jgi:hypothetical protein